MSNPQARKGAEFETAVVRVFRAAGLKAFRARQEGFSDVGDIHVPEAGLVVQAKNWADVPAALREGLAGAIRQREVAGEPFGVAVIKRRGKGAEESYAVMRLSDYIELVKETL